MDRSMASSTVTATTTTKPLGQSQVRNVSAPSVPSRLHESSSSNASAEMATSTALGATGVPRTSSIDSAISSLSHNSGSQTSETSVASLIAAAGGSPEAALHQLLKEKQSAAAQNAQLWRLVDKQRTMILGLNKDLERALKEKERYRKKLRDETTAQPSVVPDTPSLTPAPLKPSGPGPAPATDPPPKTQSLFPPQYDSEQPSTPLSAPPKSNRKPPPERLNTDHRPMQVKTTPQISPLGGPPMRHEPPPTDSNGPSPRGFGESRAAVQRQSPDQPSFALSEPSPASVVGSATGHSGAAPPARKAPPAPLDLTQPNTASAHLHSLGPDDHSESEYEDILDVDEIPNFDRGRRRTREEDDRDREIALQRSRSNRDLQPPPPPPTTQLPAVPPSAKQAVPISPPTTHGMAPGSLASMLSEDTTGAAAVRRDILPRGPLSPGLPANPRPTEVRAAPLSPGLPSSPRPNDRPMNSPAPRLPRDGASLASPPLSPRSGAPNNALSPRPTTSSGHVAGGTAPLSPRAPRYPIPLPPNTPVSMPGNEPDIEQDRPLSPTVGGSSVVYTGLVSEHHPGLLLPPNALPSVTVRVASSRMKPVRLSALPGRPHDSRSGSGDDDAVFTLGVYSRANGQGLWRLEKDLVSLMGLETQLKRSPTTTSHPRTLPDRSLFTGHAPVKVDARRDALEEYFDRVMNTPLDDAGAVAVCRYLSTDAIPPSAGPEDGRSTPSGTPGTGSGEAPIAGTSFFLTGNGDSKPRKEGYLTKRGKNFGGWKARYFTLDGPVLNYSDTPKGHVLGVIKLQHAQIGKQSSSSSSTFSASKDDDTNSHDNQYRHAFLILEPKKKDSSSLVRHVLCAESDTERDQWVAALLQYVDDPTAGHDDPASTAVEQPSRKMSRSDLFPRKRPSIVSGAGSRTGGGTKSPPPEDEQLQAVGYADTVEGEAPVRGGRASATTSETPTPSPPTPGGTFPGGSKLISGPTNGARIEDAESWGNRTIPQKARRGIFGFRGRSSGDLATPTAPQPHSPELSSDGTDRYGSGFGTVRAVFGAPLAEAAEFAPPQGVPICLPAVVYRCIEYLDARQAANEEGIFRLSGSNTLIKSLRERFNTEGDVNFLAASPAGPDIHAVASLLKLYLRELPASVLTRELHIDFLHVIEVEDKQNRVSSLHNLVQRLPLANFTLLRCLSAFLITIVNNSDMNKMTIRNVGIVFSPTLNIPAPVISLFLTFFGDIFGETDGVPMPGSPLPLGPATFPTAPTHPGGVTMDDIRSPRRQMFQDLPTPGLQTEPSRLEGGFVPMHQPPQTHEKPTWGVFPPERRASEAAPSGASGGYGVGSGWNPGFNGHSGSGLGPSPLPRSQSSLDGIMNDTRPADKEREKQSKRESSLFSLSPPPDGGGLAYPGTAGGPFIGQRKSSMPQLREGMVLDDNAFSR